MKKNILPQPLLEQVHQTDSQDSQQEHQISRQVQTSQIYYPENFYGLEREIQQSKKIIAQKISMRKNTKKVVVGTGYSFDITEFFKFQPSKTQTGNQTIFDQISGGRLAWFILLYSVCNAAMIPPWNMNIEASKFLRTSWRFFMQTFILIPFALFQYRSGNEEVKAKYEWKFIFERENFKKICLSAFTTTFWTTCIPTCNQFTNVSHAMVLGSLSNFFLSINRTKKSSSHELQPGGQVLIIIGIILILTDTLTFDTDKIGEEYWEYKNTWYLGRSRWQRLIFDLAALFIGYCMSKLSLHTTNLKKTFPPYLSMMLANMLVSINMSLMSYFFHGATFSYDEYWGIFSIFSQKHFITFLYLSIILCVGMIISFMMLTKLFLNPIIPSLAMTFQPIICCCFLDLAGCQKIPGVFSFLGYIVIIPGNFLILIGQWIFQKKAIKEENEERARLTQLTDRQTKMSDKSKRLMSKQSFGSRSPSGSPRKIEKRMNIKSNN